MYPQGACILIVDDNNLLAVRRKNPPYHYCLPGGKVEPGENIVDAAIRELYEETGRSVKSEDLFPLYSGYCGSSTEPTYWVTSFYAKVHKIKGVSSEPELQAQYININSFIENNAFRTYNLEVFVRAVALGFMS